MAMVKKTNLRKTGGRKSTTLIQSPTVKRIHSRPVTLQGWLQKRGSDGLMLWKKRWFVLSDYCLFYYKDPEEETLLGSFVLASWIISPCTHKDKVYKKYSFKAEHNNMRTYYFAADNDVIMAQWLKALTMASLLQESPRLTSKINNSQMNQLRPKEHNIHRSQQPPVGYNYGFHSSGRVISADNQPLYVNAPPKPKRLNDGSTPDPTEEESRMLMYHEGTSSGYYNNGPVPGHYVPGPPGMNGSHNLNNVVPRTNAVANSYQPPPTAASHYECLRTSYTLNQVAGGPHPPRPRSVDFLEYESKLPHNVNNPAGPKLITLPRRPKSSMSISAPRDEPMESTAWSEESYAKKMRESAMYVRPDNDNSTASIRTASSQHDRDVVSPSNENIDVSNTSALLVQKNHDPTRGAEPDPNLFKRSASARLPEVTKPASDPYGRDAYNASVTPDSKKVQQREESMKRLLEWKQRMLQSPLTQKQSPDSRNFAEMSNVQPTPPRHADMNPGSSLHHDEPSKHDIERRDLLEIRSHSVPISDVEHPYDMDQTNYNAYAYQGPSKRMELRAAEDVTDVDTVERSVTKRKNEPDSSKQMYSALSFDYPPADNSPYSAKHSSGNQANYYVDNCEPSYSGSAKNKVPNGFPTSREGTLYRGSNSLKKTSKGASMNETDEEWGLKLDESSVIKEFSYHYIKNDEFEGHSPGGQSLDAPNPKCINRRQALQKQNTVQSPITIPHNYPSHESNEDSTFPNVDAQPSPSRNKPLPVGILKNLKSRKKLDLEPAMDANTRKARWNQPYSTEVHDKRQVFSDTETLLYETSSEAEDREKTGVNAKFANVSSDDDRDEEVAAVLAKEHKTHAGLPETVKSPVKVRPASSGFYSTSQESSAVCAHLSISCENITELPEENYMPMTPRKRTVSASPLKDDSSMMSPTNTVENETLLGIEECPYVEMTQSGNSKVASMPGNLDASGCLNPDTKYFNPPSSLVESRRAPYDAGYHDIPGQEPLYMEVSNVESKSQGYHNQLHSSSKVDEGDGEEEEAREGHAVNGALPDILNTTAPSLLHHGSRRSDSSDADDEASKDLDSIDAPRHPRFSLSDTFRPASYYLGSSLSERAIIALNSSDHHDSSDSDLVSPPPIPTCSPPLDDLDTSIDSTINNKDLGLINSKEDFHQTLSGEDKFRYGCISKNNLQAASSHNETGSSEEESVKSVRTRHFMKRRPLSADILNSLSDFNVLDSSSEVKDPILYDPYDRNETKILHNNLRSHNTAAVSPQTVATSDKYNPYRKNGLNNRNKPSYDWGQPTAVRNSYHEANLPSELKDMQVPLNVSISSDRKYGENCMVESQPYNLPSSARAHLVSYDVSPLPPSVSQDSAYANSAMLAQESQNNAPYYYSDLFKVDSRNSLNRMGKPEEQVLFDKNNLIRSYSEDGSIVTTRNNYPVHGSSSSADAQMYSEKIKYTQDASPGPYNAFLKSDHFPDEMKIESHRRARSLEGLLDSRGLTGANPPVAPMNVDYGMTLGKHRPPPTIPTSGYNPPMPVPQRPYHPDGEWLGGSRRAVRHARSLEELDRKGEHPTADLPSSGHHEVVYANSDISRKGHEVSDQRVSAEKEREKIRQWDLMSSAPSTLGQEVLPYMDNHAQKIVGSNPTNSSAKPEVLQPVISIDDNQKANWELKFSAGDLLGRTHEELVLLLIQLRRQRASVCKSMERCHREIEAHACLTDFDSINRLEHIQKLDELKSRLIELEKQYEKGKPLVNLVDNMVKLGSLYQSGPQSVPSEKLEFNHKVQEQRILADERRDWERIRADHQELQAKVEQLYRLDKLLQEESGTLHSLQEDKGVLERALGGLKSKLQGIHGNTAETEWYRRQQRLLERELSRVRSILALNSKKLEETVAENARLEQELVVLRQKLQMSRRTAEPGGAATAALESELCRVQLLVGNLLRQRQELSAQVRQLTEKSNSLSQQIWPSLPDNLSISAISKKKHSNGGWIETDLDMGGISSPANEDGCSSSKDRTMSPLYVNTSNTDKQHGYYGEHSGYQEDCLDEMSPLNARSPDPYRSDVEDDGSKKACGSNWREKPQEIKTVRIVKRESERRQRDRDHRSGNIGIPLTCNSKRVIPEEVTLVPISEKQPVDSPREENCPPTEPSDPPPTPGPRSDSVHAVWNIVRKNKLKGNIVSGGPIENFEPPDFNEDSPQLSPVYLSEAARKIVEEVAWQGRGEKRLIPRERRRHHTVSGLSLNPPKHLYSQKGSRDDLDMERVLRPRLTTPDVVRSTLNRTDTSFTKETIDNILGAPGKIVIPERYIPESQPQLSKEEIIKRSKKADAIRKMLCETAPTVAPKEGELKERQHSVKHQAEEEKRNREHLLQLSQILAQEVMEKSKIVAVRALASLPLVHSPIEEESDDDLSPISALPLYQQRENFYS